MVLLVAIFLGFTLGFSWGGDFGALVGAVLGWLIVRSFRQQRAIAALEEALRAARYAPKMHHAAAPPDMAQEVTQEVALAPASARPASAVPVSVDIALKVPPAGVEPESPGMVATPSSTPPREPRIELPLPGLLGPIKEWLLGGNTIAKLGVGILFIGLAFLAKFASEHVHVPIELRLAGIGAAAIVLLAIGWRLRTKRPGYAQVLQGAAVAVLYLTLFVAFRFYEVLAVMPVFALMVAVAVLAAGLAVLQNARALAVIGALGGFATPLLVSSGSGNHVALFSYYLVLDAGIALVAWYRTWPMLNLIGFVSTFIVATAWGVLQYQPEHYASSQGFLIVFFLLFVAIMLLPLRHDAVPREPAPRGDAWVQGALLFGLPTITFVLQHGLVRDTEYGSAISALVLAVFYIALAFWMRARQRFGAAFDGSLAVGTVFTALVIPFALDARSTAGAWALEGAGLVWMGWRQSRWLARAFGYALLLFAGAAMLYGYVRHGSPTVVFNAYLFNSLMAAAASLAAALFSARHARHDAVGLAASEELAAEPVLIAWATLWLLGAAALEIDCFVLWRFKLAAWIVSVSAIACFYALLSLRFEWPRVAIPVVAHAPLLAVFALYVAATLARPLDDGGWWAWPIAFATHVLVLWRLAPRWLPFARDTVHALGVIVVALLGALQGRAITAGWGDSASAWAWLGWLVAPALLLMLLPRPAVARRWPVNAAPTAYQWGAAVPLAAGLLAWVLLANISSDGSALPVPYVPVANPLDLGIGVALLAVVLWFKSVSTQAKRETRQTVVAAMAGATFVWLNAMVVRGFHHYGDVPFRLRTWMDSLAVQTGITLLWTSIALVLMWFSARHAMRTPWMVGAALLAAVVAKLLLVDLSGSGTVTRIVSFIGVGVLMLVIGYVAPLPGRSSKESPHA